MNRETVLTKVLIALSVLFLLFGNFSLWLSNNIYNSQNFKNNVMIAFKEESVRDAIAAKIVDQILKDNPTLSQIAASPAEKAISGILGSSQLEPLIDRASQRFQQYLTTGQEEVSIDLAPVNTLISRIAQATGNTEQVPEIKNTSIVILPANAFPRLNKWLKPITTAGPILGVIGLVVLGIIVYRSELRLLRFREIGLYLVLFTAANILLLPFISSLINQYSPDENVATVASAVFDTFVDSYLYQLLLILLIGLIFVFLPSLYNLFAKTKERK